MTENKYQDLIDLFTDEYSKDINKDLGATVLDVTAQQKKIDAGLIQQWIDQHAFVLQHSLESTRDIPDLNHDERFYIALTDTFGDGIQPPYRGA